MYSIRELKNIQRVKKCRLTANQWTQPSPTSSHFPPAGWLLRSQVVAADTPTAQCGSHPSAISVRVFIAECLNALLSRQAVFRPRTATLLKWKRKSLWGIDQITLIIRTEWKVSLPRSLTRSLPSVVCAQCGGGRKRLMERKGRRKTGREKDEYCWDVRIH